MYSSIDENKVRRNLNFAGCKVKDIILYCYTCFDQKNVGQGGAGAIFRCHTGTGIWEVTAIDLDDTPL